MVKDVKLYCKTNNAPPPSLNYQLSKNFLEITIQGPSIKLESLAVHINFQSPITLWRRTDYKWVNATKRLFSNTYSPKILQLKNGLKVVGNKPLGTWVFNPKNKQQLKWLIHDKWLTPLYYYENGKRIFIKPTYTLKDKIVLKLFFTEGKAPEFSRSKIPFSGIICLTDHCDYDNIDLLVKQRALFKERNIKVTKGFFMYHYSKRPDNTSYENHPEEYKKWIADGHELAYHSLNQTKKNDDNASLYDFNTFIPPFNISTWIDHGFLPYNFSMQKTMSSRIDWLNKTDKKNIKYIWNYVDSAETGNGLINQLNSNDLTPINLYKSLKTYKLKTRLFSFLKLYVFYFSSEKTIMSYKKSIEFLKGNLGFNIITVLKHLPHLLRLQKDLVILCTCWPFKKNRLPSYAQFTPSIFHSPFSEEQFFFQTMATKHFSNTFNKENLEKLISESGLCISHTYFSFLEKHHKGRLFKDERGAIQPESAAAFTLLGSYLKQNKLWNPTLRELASYLSTINSLEFIQNRNGDIKLKKQEHPIPLRYI